MRNRKSALEEFRRLLADGANELYLLTMIARQVRLMLSIKDLLGEQGMTLAQASKEVGIRHRFIADKLLTQSRLFEESELEGLVQRLVEIDHRIKTGRIEGVLALELLILGICQRRPRRRAKSRSGTRQAARSA